MENAPTQSDVIEILKQGLYHVKDYLNRVHCGDPSLCPVWNIANNTLMDAGIEPKTDNDRSAI